MATSGKEVAKNAMALKRAMGMRGVLKPGDLQAKATQIMAQPNPMATSTNGAAVGARKIPALKTKKGVAVRGLI